MKVVGSRGIALGILAAGCLTGCALGPDYKRPPVSPPETFRFQATPGETASLADAPWWEAFGDPALKTLIQEALAGNYNVRIAAARVQQARAQAAGAKSPFYPQLGYQATAVQSKGLANILGLSSTNAASAESTLYLGAISMNWEIDLWGKLRRSSEAANAQLLARNPGPIQRGRPLFDQEVTPSVPAGLPSALLERRPDLRRVEQELVAANAQIGAAKALFFPQLSLTGLIGKASPELSALTAGTSTIWQAGGMLTGPIFQGGKILGNYRVTVAAWEETKWKYEQSVIQAFQEVSSSLAALEKLAGAETEQIRAVKALEQSVKISRDRYIYGLSSYYEVLEALQRLYPAQNLQAQIRLGRLTAYVQLYKALG